MGTYVDGEVEEIKRARVRNIRLIPPRIVFVGSSSSTSCAARSNGEATARKHRHEDVGNVHQHRAKHLLRHIKEPYLDRPLRALPPALVDERQQG